MPPNQPKSFMPPGQMNSRPETIRSSEWVLPASRFMIHLGPRKGFETHGLEAAWSPGSTPTTNEPLRNRHPPASSCPPLSLQPAPDPPQHFPVPKQRVRTLQGPVILVRERDQPRGDALGLEHPVALEPLAHRDAVALLAVDHQHRGVEPARVARRVPAVDHLDPLPRLAAHRLGPALGHVARVLAHQVVDAGVVPG